MKKTCVAALLLCATQAAPANSVFDHPADAAQLARDLEPAVAGLRQAQTLRGRYRQTKVLHEVPRPLLAEGTFVFARGVGIAWRTVKPFASELVITREAIVQRDGAGQVLRLSAGQQPGVRALAGTLEAVFALDFAALGSLFELHSQRTDQAPASAWELGLRPRRGMGGAVQSIVVSGRSQVERVVLHDSSGDVTDIRLSGTRASSEPLTAEEIQQFLP